MGTSADSGGLKVHSVCADGIGDCLAAVSADFAGGQRESGDGGSAAWIPRPAGAERMAQRQNGCPLCTGCRGNPGYP